MNGLLIHSSCTVHTEFARNLCPGESRSRAAAPGAAALFFFSKDAAAAAGPQIAIVHSHAAGGTRTYAQFQPVRSVVTRKLQPDSRPYWPSLCAV